MPYIYPEIRESSYFGPFHLQLFNFFVTSLLNGVLVSEYLHLCPAVNRINPQQN